MKTQDMVVFLRGKKAILRPPEESDVPLFVRWLNDKEVTRFLEMRMPLMRITEKKWFEGLSDRKDSVTLTIVTLAGKPIGVMSINNIDWIDGTANTGAFIGEKSYWGKGYGTDAKMQILNFAFNTLNLRKICSRVYAFNKRSVAYSKHCGYRDDGVQRNHVFRNGEYHDVIQLAIFKEDWLPYWRKYLKKKS